MKQSKTRKKNQNNAKTSNNLAHCSINQLMTISGMGYRTVVKRLKDNKVEQLETKGRAHMYETPMAVAALFHVEQSNDGGKLNPTIEKAKLLNQQWRMVKVQRKKLKNDLVEADKIQFYLDTMVTNMKTKMLSIPNTTAKMLSTLKDKTDIVDFLTMEIKEALTDLSSDNKWLDSVVDDE